MVGVVIDVRGTLEATTAVRKVPPTREAHEQIPLLYAHRLKAIHPLIVLQFLFYSPPNII